MEGLILIYNYDTIMTLIINWIYIMDRLNHGHFSYSCGGYRSPVDPRYMRRVMVSPLHLFFGSIVLSHHKRSRSLSPIQSNSVLTFKSEFNEPTIGKRKLARITENSVNKVDIVFQLNSPKEEREKTKKSNGFGYYITPKEIENQVITGYKSSGKTTPNGKHKMYVPIYKNEIGKNSIFVAAKPNSAS